jgi:two-component sensor histidine kinase
MGAQTGPVMSAELRKKRFRVPVTALTIALILALAAPSLAFSALLLLQSDSVNRATMTSRAAQGVDAVAETLERELRAMLTNLSVLASSGWVETEQYDRLHAKATEALAGADMFLVAVDANYHQILNTRLPWGTPLDTLSNSEGVARALATGRPALSNVFNGRLAQEPVFNITMPVISGEGKARALILSRTTKSLNTIFRDSQPPPGWTYSILDAAGGLAAGSAPEGAPELVSRLCINEQPGLQDTVVGDISYSAASEKLEFWDWRACVWTSSAQTDGQISQRWRSFTILTLVVVAVTVLAGAALGRMLAGAIRKAATVGRALDAGTEVPETHSIVREVDDVMATITRAARSRLQHEEEQKVLLRETAHRAKNQIAIASALARLSAKQATNVDQLRDDIVARLSALGRSIDMMSASPSGAVKVKQLAETQLEPFAADHPGRLELAGDPNIRVAPATAQALGLVLHEMATNAAKYGSWSTPDGAVRLDWKETDKGLTVEWAERGGPAPQTSDRQGFGSSLIEMMIERSLNGTIERDYRPTGLVATFRLPAIPVTV